MRSGEELAQRGHLAQAFAAAMVAVDQNPVPPALCGVDGGADLGECCKLVLDQVAQRIVVARHVAEEKPERMRRLQAVDGELGLKRRHAETVDTEEREGRSVGLRDIPIDQPPAVHISRQDFGLVGEVAKRFGRPEAVDNLPGAFVQEPGRGRDTLRIEPNRIDIDDIAADYGRAGEVGERLPAAADQNGVCPIRGRQERTAVLVADEAGIGIPSSIVERQEPVWVGRFRDMQPLDICKNGGARAKPVLREEAR